MQNLFICIVMALSKSVIVVLVIFVSSVVNSSSNDLRHADSNYYVSCSDDYCNFCCLKISSGSIRVVRYIGIGYKHTDSSFCKEGLIVLGSCNVSVDYVVDISHRTSTVSTTAATTTTAAAANTPPPPLQDEHNRCPGRYSSVNDICTPVESKKDDDEDYEDDEDDSEDNIPTSATSASDKPAPLVPAAPIPARYVYTPCRVGLIRRADGICVEAATLETTTTERLPEHLLFATVPENCPNGQILVNGSCKKKDE